MTGQIKNIVENVNLDSEDSIRRALDQAAQMPDLTDEEKNELTAAFSTLFYHDYAGRTEMIKLAARAEKVIAGFGAAVVPFMLKELIEADSESAAHISRIIARNGEEALRKTMDAMDANREDDGAIINIITALGFFRDPVVLKAMPEIVVAAKSKNPQVRAEALYAIGKLVRWIGSNHFDETLRLKLFDTAFEAVADKHSLARSKAVRALGKMLQKGLLASDQKDKCFKAFSSLLGNDERREWDSAFIVRHEAEQFLPLCKAGSTLKERYTQSFRIMVKKELSPNTFYYEIEAPFIARKLQAGQFIIIRPHQFAERIPLSIAGWDEKKGTINVIIATAGRTSGEINAMNVGQCLTDIVGPLGQRSHVKKHEGTCVVVGGGYGTGAIIPTARDFKKLGNRVVGIVGSRSKDLLIMVDELKEICDEVLITTNDGSDGIKGFVTHALEELLKKGEKISHILAVGPPMMMMAVCNMTKPLGIETYVSLNAIMVDGTGMCGACRVMVDGETRFACFHGPDFDGHKVDFDLLMKRQRMFVPKEKEALEAIEQ
ncbi:MAG: sulfide/dihydroorotate dehydrogenase-like FAD/NAD-binding protein [Nitrospinota bacterium]